jgi:hypothetical protein
LELVSSWVLPLLNLCEHKVNRKSQKQ